MPPFIRTFRSRQGHEAELVRCLRRAASSMVRHLQAESIVICRQTNDSEQIVWIGDRGRESDFTCLPGWENLIKTFERSLLGSSSPLSLRFLDEFYRFPPPPYQVWSLEVHTAPKGERDTLKDVFDLSVMARHDRRVVGMSLYRAVETPGAFIGFLGVTGGLTPSQLARNGAGPLRITEVIERAVTWRPLSVAWEVQRRPARQRPAERRETAFPTRFLPFWLRSGAVSKPPPTQDECHALTAEGYREAGD